MGNEGNNQNNGLEPQDGYFNYDPNYDPYADDEFYDDPGMPDINISWKASEYVHHDKGIAWSAGLIAVSVAIAGGLFLILNGDWSIVVLVLVMTVAIYIYGNRKPRTLSYNLSGDGITIDEETYDYSRFRSFSIIQDDGLFSIELMPLQRFRPAMSIYFSPQDGEKIVDVLSNFLPLEERSPDYVERLVKKIKF